LRLKSGIAGDLRLPNVTPANHPSLIVLIFNQRNQSAILIERRRVMPKCVKHRTAQQTRAAFPGLSLISLISLISFDCFSNAEPGRAG